ncbi:MAG: putative carboxyvinyl-carboxyphosphonate phosphorylmutase [Solirubrobacterales bacterium]|nr:putative carboxyvinyl-carboxyphosphonate phosphorylmutase [Solirubrobacterales bacterium]
MTDRHAQAAELLRLHQAPQILVLANVWDVASARAVAAVEGVAALATASHAIAAAHGYPDGEQIPLELHLASIERITAGVGIPVTADLEAGYGDPGETTRRAIAAGAVGMNLEDELMPVMDAIEAVEAVVAAREAENTGFVLNARTDAILKAPEGKSPADVLADATVRGRAYLAAGADCVFVPGARDPETIAALADAFGPQRLSVLAGPGSLPIAELERLGVARASIGPFGYRVALTALQDATAELLAGGSLPEGVRPVV